MDKYMAEANAVIDEEIERVKGEQEPRLRPAPAPVEVDYTALRDFYNELLPPGGRPNFSSHQTFAFLQNERNSLDILASRLRVASIGSGLHQCI